MGLPDIWGMIWIIIGVSRTKPISGLSRLSMSLIASCCAFVRAVVLQACAWNASFVASSQSAEGRCDKWFAVLASMQKTPHDGKQALSSRKTLLCAAAPI
eukprot:1148607-Pelagomonas_calceolata.AAC.23